MSTVTMKLLESVNKVDSKVISRISGVQKKRPDGSEYFYTFKATP